MTRGHPAFWSGLLSLPFLGGGTHLYLNPRQVVQGPGVAIPPGDLQLLGLSLACFGAFVLLVGVYVELVPLPSPSLYEDEEMLDTRSPSQRVAISKILLSVPFLGAAVYLLLFTLLPYVYPTVALLVGLYFFSSGLKTYWINTLTTYYVTTRRVIGEYRFVSLRRQEIPLNKVRGIEERQSALETLVGLGNLRVASGGGSGSVLLVIRNVTDATGFADQFRDLTD